MSDTCTIETFADILSQIDRLASEIGARGIRLQPPPPVAGDAPDPALASTLRAHGYSLSPHLTALIDLSAPQDQIFAAFKHAARKGIRKCQKAGVYVEQCASRDAFIEDFCAPYFEQDTNAGHNIRRSLVMWDLDDGEHYRFFVAKDADNRVLATLGTFAFNGVATEIMSHRTTASFAENLPAQDVLHWQVYQAHKDAGDRWFDLAGYKPKPDSEREAGIRRFKQKWGGHEMPVSSFTKHNPTLIQRTWHSLRHRSASDAAPLSA